MTSTRRQQFSVLFRAYAHTVYGKDHPLAFDSGGSPEGIREMLPADIRKFHREHYFLGNMGSIVSLPKGDPIDQTLGRLDQILTRVQPDPVSYPIQTEATLPSPKPAPAGSISIHDYPVQNDKQPGTIALAWPADRHLDQRELMLFDVFMDNVAAGASSNLYKLFINSATRKFDIGAAGVFNNVSTDPGFAAMIGFRDVAVSNVTPEKITEVRQAVLDDFKRIAAWPDNSPDLLEFNGRLKTLLTQRRRELGKISNSPPGFGFRTGSAFWMQHLDRLNKEPDFRKSLTMAGDFAALEALLATPKNIWTDRVQAWRLTTVQPFGLGTRPNPALLKIDAEQRQARLAAETRRLMAEYHLDDEQQALQRYKREYETQTAELDRLASPSSHLKFIDNPPMTMDDQLDYRVTKLKNDIPLVASTFENMTSATTGLALRIDGVPEADLFLLTLLPSLLTQTGVILDGKPVSFEDMQQMLRKEILGVSASFAADLASGRRELIVQGSGNDLTESRRAVDWMKLVLLHPNWTPANLPESATSSTRASPTIAIRCRAPKNAGSTTRSMLTACRPTRSTSPPVPS